MHPVIENWESYLRGSTEQPSRDVLLNMVEDFKAVFGQAAPTIQQLGWQCDSCGKWNLMSNIGCRCGRGRLPDNS